MHVVNHSEIAQLLNISRIFESKFGAAGIVCLHDLAWIFNYFCMRIFILFSPIKKESRIIL